MKAEAGRRAQILVVEDDTLAAMELGSLIAKAGHQVAGLAYDGRDALQHALRAKPDLAFVDIRLRGGLDGIEVAHELARLRVPVVFATAHADVETVARARSAHPFGYVIKPFSEPAVRAAIEVASCRLEVEENIRNDEQRFESTLHGIGDAVIAADRNGTVTFMTAVAEELSGWSASEAVGRPLAEVFALFVNGEPVTKRLTREVLASGRLVRVKGDATLCTRRDTRLPIDESMAPTRDPAGKVSGVVIVFRDRTAALQAAQDKARRDAEMFEAQRIDTLGVLAGGVAHDFNNLLAIIQGNATLIGRELASHSKVAARVRDIERATSRGADLCSQLLAYAGHGRESTDTIDLNQLLKDSERLLRISVPMTIRLEYEHAHELPSVEGDPGRIRQVVLNLISNAAEAIGPHSGTIRVRTFTAAASDIPAQAKGPPGNAISEAFAVLEVRDTGHGIDPLICPRVFDPFFSTRFQGRGLGLAAVRGIVDAHRGWISVDSKAQEGTTFRIFFPACGRVPEIAAPPLPAPHLGSLGTGRRVLVVDDEEMIRGMTSAIVEGFGYEVTQACDGEHAVRLVRDDPDGYEFVLMDFAMPSLNGTEAALALVDVAPSLPIVLVSGYSESWLRMGAGASNVVVYLQKPYSLAQLEAAILAARARRTVT